jgi:hypothetical protein
MGWLPMTKHACGVGLNPRSALRFTQLKPTARAQPRTLGGFSCAESCAKVHRGEQLLIDAEEPHTMAHLAGIPPAHLPERTSLGSC